MDLAKLTLRLESENANLMSHRDATTRRLQTFQRSTKSITSSIKTALVGLGAGFSVVAFTRSMRDTINGLDELSKSAQKTGVGVETLSALRFAADLAGVSAENLSASFRRLATNSTEAIRGVKEARAVFEAIGISLDDLKSKSPDALLREIADRFAGYSDGAGKATLAAKLFGEEQGSRMIPLLNQGARGIQRMEERARSLGVVVSSETAASAERFNDSLTEMNAAMDGFKLKVVSDILPSLSRMTQAFTETYGAGFTLFRFWDALKALGGVGPFADPAKVFNADALRDHLKDLRKEYDETQRKLAKGLHFDPETKAVNVPSAMQLYLDTLSKQIIATETRIRDLGAMAQPINNVGKEILKLNDYWQLGALTTEEYGKRVQALAGVKVEAPIIKDPPKMTSVEKDLERLNATILRQNDLWQRGIIGVEEYHDAIRRATDLPVNIPGVDALQPVDLGSRVADQLSALADMLKSQEEIENEAYERRRKLIEQNISDEEARNAALVQLALKNSERLVEIEQQKYSAFTQVQENAIGLSAELLGQFATKSKVAAVAQIGITKALAIAQTLAHTQTAAVLAYASQLVPGVPATYVAAADAYKATQALGKLSAGVIAGIGFAQAASAIGGGSGGSGGGSSRGGGTSLSDPSITPITAPKAQNVVQVVIQGDMYGWDDYIQTKVISGIRKAVDNADVVLISGTSRNGRELMG